MKNMTQPETCSEKLSKFSLKTGLTFLLYIISYELFCDTTWNFGEPLDPFSGTFSQNLAMFDIHYFINKKHAYLHQSTEHHLLFAISN